MNGMNGTNGMIGMIGMGMPCPLPEHHGAAGT